MVSWAALLAASVAQGGSPAPARVPPSWIPAGPDAIPRAASRAPARAPAGAAAPDSSRAPARAPSRPPPPGVLTVPAPARPPPAAVPPGAQPARPPAETPAPPAPPRPAPPADRVIRPELSRTQANVGDVLTYTIRIVHDAEEKYHVPPEPPFGALELVSKEYFHRDLGSGKVEETFVFRIAGYKAGSFLLPAMEIPYLDRDGKSRRMVAQDVQIVVQSLLPPAPQLPKPRDPKPPVPIFERDHSLIYLLAALVGAALAAGIGLWAYRYGQRRAARPKPVPPPPPPRPAHEVAIEKLDELARLDLPANGLVKEHYDRVGDVVREYLFNRYGIPALDMTTDELARALRMLGERPGLDRKAIHAFLDEGDLVKFARYVPDPQAPYRYLAAARGVVEATRTRESATAAAPPTAAPPPESRPAAPAAPPPQAA